MPIRRYVKDGVVFTPQRLSSMSRAFEATTETLGIGSDEAKASRRSEVHHSAGTGRRQARCGRVAG
jgi:hypothetical protein